MNFIKKLFKDEIVTVIAFFLAIISMFFVRPDREYLYYINFETIFTLFILMLIVVIIRYMNIFQILGELLVSKASDVRSIAYVYILLCFFTSMFITNDVALITFVPFSIEVFNMIQKKNKIMALVILETIAANLGSALMPIGNPQNIYLFQLANISIKKFMKIMLPYGIVSLILLIICVFIIFKNEKVSVSQNKTTLTFKNINIKLLGKVDYFLLLTFVFLFVFIGNISRIEFLNSMLLKFIKNNEFMMSIIMSQVISNVPAAILLSKFTTNYIALIVGCNVGGLGTIIASMASLISYKFYVKTSDADTKKYILNFTVFNLIFLIILIFTNLMIK